jgi:hypothetical protein
MDVQNPLRPFLYDKGPFNSLGVVGSQAAAPQQEARLRVKLGSFHLGTEFEEGG